jgi:hypothetical protein
MSQEREQKLKALRRIYSGWVPQHELDKLDGIEPAKVAQRFAPQQVDLEEAVQATAEAPKKPRKQKILE